MEIKFVSLDGKLLKTIIPHDTQKAFLKDKTRYILYSGGFRAGKTFAMCLKVYWDHLRQPNNYGLMGRLHYPELKDALIPSMMEIIPPQEIRRFGGTPPTLTMKNGSTLIFRHLDTVSEQEIRGLNLGFFAIDQAEEIDENIFLALRGRLSRKVAQQQGLMTCNPVLNWLYKYFKQNQDPSYKLYEGSTLDNAKNLPKETVEDLLKYPESWKRQFVYGIWDESLLADKAYFPIEYIQEQKVFAKQPIRIFEGLSIFEEVQFDDEYQIGVDPADSGEDSSAIIVVSKRRAQIVASWKGKIPADSLAQIVAKVGRIYRDARVVLEINGIGLATLTALKDIYSNIYKRQVLDEMTKKRMEKLGWRTTYGTKILLLDNFLKLLRENKARVFDERILDEMKTFIWTDEARRSGLGAQVGFHDDLVMATALAFWEIKGDLQANEINITPPKGSFLAELEKRQRINQDFIGN